MAEPLCLRARVAAVCARVCLLTCAYVDGGAVMFKNITSYIGRVCRCLCLDVGCVRGRVCVCVCVRFRVCVAAFVLTCAHACVCVSVYFRAHVGAVCVYAGVV